MAKHARQKNQKDRTPSPSRVEQTPYDTDFDAGESRKSVNTQHPLPLSLSSRKIRHLQSVIGNQAVMRLIQRKRAQQHPSSIQPALQRRVNPEDVSEEMKGMTFEVVEEVAALVLGISAVTLLSKGDELQIVSWDNDATKVTANPIENGKVQITSLMVPKASIKPKHKKVKGVAQYGAGLDKVRKNYKRGQQRITEERNREGGPRPDEIPRLEELQENRQELLNKRLIQEAMFNRFDETIKKWVDHYNKARGFDKKDPLDPNLVKSMLFQESQMGTSGTHLEVPPSHPVKTRFNLGQVIDSSASALLIMMREMQPDLITKHGLEDIEEKRGDRGAEFYWSQSNFVDAMNEFFQSVAAGEPERNVDYEFWIRIAVRWLFHKRQSVKSWEEAIRAYNGSGARARQYRAAVKKRAKEAKKAESKGTEFVPGRI